MAEKKNVLVVGASRGLGLALAEEYCARDWQIIATCRASEPAKGQAVLKGNHA